MPEKIQSKEKKPAASAKPMGTAASAARTRMAKKKHKPSFNVLNAGFLRSVKTRWRKPRGIDNKKRVRKAWAGASPRIGYRNPPAIRGLHPLGQAELLVFNLAQLQNASGKLIRVASAVGARKRIQIEAKAKEMGLVILNPKMSKAKMPKEKGTAQARGIKVQEQPQGANPSGGSRKNASPPMGGED